MNWYKVFYWISVADGVKGFFDTFSNVFLFLTIIFFLGWIFSNLGANDSSLSNDERSSFRNWRGRFAKWFWISFISCVVLWAGYVFTPSKKDALIIVAGGAVGNFITSDSSAKQLPAEFTLLLREKIKSEIKEIQTPTTDTLISKSKEELIELLKNK